MKKKSFKKICKMRQKHLMDIIRSRKNEKNMQNSTETSESSNAITLENVSPRTIQENTSNSPSHALDLKSSNVVTLSTVQENNTQPSCDALNLKRTKSQCTYHNKTNKYKQKNKENNPFLDKKSVVNGGEERRIIDIIYYTNNLLDQISKHSPFNCSLEGIEIYKEKRVGLSSKITFYCKMCNSKFIVNTCDPKPKNALDINTSTVTGMTVTGIGLAQLSELFAAMNLPQMSQTMYNKVHATVSKKWEETATDSMEAAARREREAAISEGMVKNGIAVIDVIADGCWGKRSYRKNYSALSGAAVIIGRKFGEVLYLGVRNKYCSICAQAEKKSLQPKQHTCFKNYTGPSTGMESDIIVEGFKHSVDMHQIIYGRLIGDGDCNTYSKILEARPYKNVTVEKLECKNHLLRNMCNKLTAIATDTRFLLTHRKMITTQRILAIRKAICLAIEKHSSNNTKDISKKVNDLYRDISNSSNHAFGEHNSCEPYYCQSKKTSENLVPKLKTSSIWNKIQYIVGVVAANSRSLVFNVNSNIVEGFNSIVAKFVGGKRTNLSSRQSYQTRCNAAVVSFNSKKPMYTIQKKILGVSPKGKSKLLEERRIRKNIQCRGYARRKILFPNNSSSTSDKNYGDGCEKPDKGEEEMALLKDTFLKNLCKSDVQRKAIERETVLQRESSEWLELRRQLITASNFGKIVKRRETTGASIVKSLLYKRDITHVMAIKHGVDNEHNALNQLCTQLNVVIEPCGLFLDPDIPYLGATPDGLIGCDQVVEIKCPISVFNLKSIKDAVKKKKLPFYKLLNDQLQINKSHNWYFQVQGQLHITRRNSCVFAIWMGENTPLHVEYIRRDIDFFRTKMLPKLSSFYFDYILPELLDPRVTRNLPLRGSKKRNAPNSPSRPNKKQKTTCQNNITDNEYSESLQILENIIDFENM